MTEEEKKIAEDEIAAGPEGNRPTQSTTSVANQGSGTSEVPFPVDKSQNYPSTQPASTPVVADGQQATATTTTGQEQQPASTPIANQPQQATTPNVNPAENPDNYTFTESELQAMEQQQTPQGGVVGDGVSSTGLYNWDNPGTTIDRVLADPGNKNSTGAIVNDYLKWAYRNNQPIDYFAINEAIHNKDISKSPADNAKEEKRLAAKEKWDKVGNFLLHLGNVVGNVAGGGMGSVKLEDPVQWSERQRLLKERTEQLRNSYNQSTLAQMTKQNAEMRKAEMDKRRQDREDKKLEMQREKNDAYRNYQSSVASKNEVMAAYYQAKLEALEAGKPLDEALKEAKIAKEKAQTRLANVKADAGGFAPKSGTGSGGGKKTGRGGTSGYVDTYDRDRKGRTITHVRKPISNDNASQPANSSANGGKKKSTGINWVSKNKK